MHLKALFSIFVAGVWQNISKAQKPRAWHISSVQRAVGQIFRHCMDEVRAWVDGKVTQKVSSPQIYSDWDDYESSQQ